MMSFFPVKCTQGNALLWPSVLAIAVLLNLSVWFLLRDEQARWINVPPPPDREAASFSGLGDAQFSYRTIAYMLQNLGDNAGISRPLMEYDYHLLSKWLFLADTLDPRSNFIPYIAAYYFGAVQTPESLPPLVRYLEYAGTHNGGQDDKWRWLTQAIYLARYRLDDLDWSLEMARKLKDMDGKNGVNLPVWAKNMDVMLMNVMGEKDAAYGIMLQTLETEGKSMDQSEYLFMLDYICKQILTPEDAAKKPLCDNIAD